MAAKKSNPPSPSTERNPLDSIDSLRPSSLPPELGGIDMSWDDDTRSIRELGLLPDSDLDIDLDAGERTTAIPSIPMADLVAASMADAEKKELASHDEESSKVVPSEPIPEERPTVEYRVKPRNTPPPEGITRPAPARKQNEYLRSSSAPARRTSSHPPDTLQNRLNSAPPLSTQSMAGPVGPPSRSQLGAGYDERSTVAPPTTRSENDSLRLRMKDLYATGDFSGALEISDTLLTADPGDLEAQRFSTSCRDVLTQMLQSRVGQLDQIVQVALSPEELRWLTLDHRAGFLLSLVDGSITLEELLDITGMAKLESLRILVRLLDQRVIRLVTR